MVDHNRTRKLWRMNTVNEMVEFVQLWVLLQDKQYTNQEDQIRWKWTDNAACMSKWAYLAQVHGTYSTFEGRIIWKAHVSCRRKNNFFAWLLVQSKILTADKMVARHWDCNQTCPLCDQERQTALHLCLHCSYAKEVWQLMSRWTAEQVLVPEGDETDMEAKLGGPRCWPQYHGAALLMYTAWHIWKERNSRVLTTSKTLLPLQVLGLIQDEIKLCQQACWTPLVGDWAILVSIYVILSYL